MGFMEDLFEVSDQSLPGRRVKRREGFVEKDDLRFRHEGPGEVANAEMLQIAASIA